MSDLRQFTTRDMSEAAPTMARNELATVEALAEESVADDDSPRSPESLTKRLTVAELVEVYEQAERDIRAGYALVEAARQRLVDSFCCGDRYGIRIHDRWSKVNFEDPDASIEGVRRDVWQVLVDRLEIRRVMSIEAWKKLEKQLQDEDPPEITQENVGQMLRQFQGQLPEMLKAAVEEVFNWLRPHGDTYKRNSEFEIPPRVILSWAVQPDYSGGFRPHYNREQNYTALENVFSALDGKGATNKALTYSLLSQAIRDSGKSGHGKTEYFEFRCYRNGNIHLSFLRPDLLQKLNMMAGGKRLRGEKAKR